MQRADRVTMKALVQRVRSADVVVDGVEIARIGHGLVVFVGVGHDDEAADAERLAAKVAALRIFGGGTEGPERSVVDLGAGVLVVSQFTLMADTRKGNRPSWSAAAAPYVAEPLVEVFAETVRRHVGTVACGRFGAHMQIAMVNDGPVTVMLES